MDRSTADGRRKLGAAGETLTAQWYQEQGYILLGRNWRCEIGEIDLVCRRRDVLVFCEVKTRRSSRFGTGTEAVTGAKQRRLRHLAGRWLREHHVHSNVIRFDVASVRDGQVEVLEDAF